jgi:TatD DNase family protein
MIDIGANLAHDSFDHDRDAVLARAWSAGLTHIVVTGSSLESSHTALRLAHEHPGQLFATAGLHPHHATQWTSEFEEVIRQLATDPALVSLGECGLDYFRNFSSPQDQRRAFCAQLELAAELGKPVFLHQRDAHADFCSILREYRPRLAQVCVHCFTDTRAAAEDYLALDCHIGITGWVCDERRRGDLPETVAIIPDHRIMIETDAPYLLPRTLPKSHKPRDARRNEPCFLPWVVTSIASARKVSEAHVRTITSENAQAFFALPARAAQC